MKNWVRRSVSALSAAAVLLGSVGALPEGVLPVLNITAGAISDSGNITDTATYSLSADGLLTISGTGAIGTNNISAVPWYKDVNFKNRVRFVNVGEGITSIGAFMFEDFVNCTVIDLPASLTSINYTVFEGCSSLTSISVPNTSSSYYTEDGILYSKDMDILVKYPNGKTNRIFDIPSTVQNIYGCAFSDNIWLSQVNIPVGVVSIDAYAFSNTKLSSILLPDTLRSIDSRAFVSSSELYSITIPPSVKSIGNEAFLDCQKLSAINVDAANQTFYSIDGVLFSEFGGKIYLEAYPAGKKNTSYVIPNGVKCIESDAFAYCYNLNSITIPSSVTYLGLWCLEDPNLTDIYYGGTQEQWEALDKSRAGIPDGCEIHFSSVISGTIGDNAEWELDTGTGVLTISGTGMLESEYLPGSGIVIPWADYIDQIYTIVIEEGITGIDEDVLSEIPNVTVIDLPSTVEYVSNYPFWGDDKLKQIEISPYNETYCSVNGILYTKDMSTIVRYPSGKEETSFTIPYSVTAIGPCAFTNVPDLISVNIPNGVTYIGAYAFAYTPISYIELPSGLKIIDSVAFYNCDELSTVSIPAGVTEIENGAFSYCDNLGSVWVDPDNRYYTSTEDGILFNSDFTLLVCYPAGKKNDSYTIPDTVETLDESFCGNKYLKNITVPTSISYMTNSPFSCENLTDIYYLGTKTQWNNIKFTTTGIDYSKCTVHYAISGSCGENAEWALGADGTLTISGYGIVEYTGGIAPWYQYREDIKKVVICEGITAFESGSTGMFYNCKNIKSFSIPSTLTVMSSSVPSGYLNPNLESITVAPYNSAYIIRNGALYSKNGSVLYCYPPKMMGTAFSAADKITTIKDAFVNASNLKSIIIPYAERIDPTAFAGCTSLKEIYFFGTWRQWINAIGYESVIPKGAHVYCSGDFQTDANGILIHYFGEATDVNVLTSITGIAEHAFADDEYHTIGENIESIYIPSTVKAIDYEAFADLTNLKKATIDSNAVEIEEWFAFCRNIEEVNITGTVKAIGNSAFENLPKLSKVTLPDTMTGIYGCAFTLCSSLEEITLPKNLTELGGSAFSGCTALKNITVPYGIDHLEESVFSGCTSLKTVTLPEALTSVGYYAFSNCNSITDVYFGGTREQWAAIDFDRGNECLTKATIHFAKGEAVSPKAVVTLGDGQATLTWDAVDGASRYAAYTVDEAGNTTVLNSKITDTTYTAKKLTNGTTYKFLVRAYVGTKWTKYTDDEIVSCYLPYTKPVVNAEPGDKQVTLSWGAVEGASKYAAYTVDEAGNTNILNSKITDTEYTAKKLTNGTAYRFLVRAYVGTKWTKYTDDDIVTCTPAEPKPVVTAKPGNKQVTLTWDAIDGATRYAAYTVDEEGNTTILNSKITDTEYTAKKLTNGKKYRFLVRAYVGTKWTMYTDDDIVSCTPAEPKPVVTAKPGNKQVTLTWDAIDDATRYAAYMVDEKGNTTILNSKITDTEYTVKKLTNGKEYRFLVRAYVNSAWTKYTDDDIVSCTPASPKPVVKATPGNGLVKLTWNAIEGATKYAAYMVDEDGNTSVLKSKITDPKYTVKNLTNGTTYRFVVRAYVNGAWTKYTDDDIVSATPKA